MDEGEPGRVEELPPEPELTGAAVERVAGHRQVDRLEVHADLMRAAGLQGNPQERMATEQLVDLEVGHRLARRVGVERLPERIVPVAADRSVDRPATRPRPPDDERDVLARELARLHEVLEPPVRVG